jgi:tight adherence protein C
VNLEVVALVSSLLVFGAVLGAFFGVRLLLNPQRTAQDRVAELTGGRRELDPLLGGGSGVGGVASNLGALARPSDGDEADLARRRLLQAGYRSRSALEVYSAVRAGLALALPLLLWVALPQMRLVFTLFFLLAAATLGYFLPAIFLSNKLENRRTALLKPFPDALDLLVSSVEAGLGLDAAFRRVAQEIESAAPELARELQLVNHEVAAGLPRIEALRRLDQRTGLEEVNQLVNVLVQAERFGTSVARALRIHGDLVRKKRMLAAEERAAKISPKLTVAMILFILPGLFVVLAGPAFVSVVRTLIPAMSGE